MKLSLSALERHLYVLGMSGAGKSRFLADLAVKLIQKDTGIAVIDPHDTFYSLLLDHASKYGQRVWDKIILFDPLDKDYTIGFNPLELLPGDVTQRKADFLANIVAKVFQFNENITTRMSWMMFNTFWLLIDHQLTLVEYPEVLTNKELREKLLEKYPEGHELRNYWFNQFPNNWNKAQEWAQSSLNRIGKLVSDPDVKLILGQQKSTINFTDIMDSGKILLINLAKGSLGRRHSYLLGAFIMAMIQFEALKRGSRHYKPQFCLFVDEFQNYLTDDIDEILTESRKYNLSLIMAHQYFDQLAELPTLKSAVIGTTGNLISFRIGRGDAEEYAKNLFSPDIDQLKDIREQAVPTGLNFMPYRYERVPVWRNLEEIWEAEYRQLTDLPDRMFWYKRKGYSGSSLVRTHDFPDVAQTPQLRQARQNLMRRSVRQYGRSKSLVRSEIEDRQQYLAQLPKIDIDKDQQPDSIE